MLMYAHFENLPVSTIFCQNGNTYRKQSGRTAKLLEYDRVFYFSKKEYCVVGPYSLL